nr:SRPBCC domain-containing protein [uncultured Gellertiella sp.]
MNELELTVSKTIAASREKVFAAWLSPAMLSKIMRPTLGVTDLAEVTNDPVEGGQFFIIMKTAERDIPHEGTYLEIRPHSRLSFTWASAHSLDDSVVTIDFAEPKPGATDITLHQVKFRSPDARDGHVKGWTAILGNLGDALALQATTV